MTSSHDFEHSARDFTCNTERLFVVLIDAQPSLYPKRSSRLCDSVSSLGTEEVTFTDISREPRSKLQSQTRTKTGFAKVQGSCELASEHGYEWIWIDSCCIDKSSSAELQETINSMWRYYAESNVCYVYMADVPDSEAGWGQMFANSEWFTRGWTLQELIAPPCVEFYAKDWKPIGTKLERHKQIAEITSINPSALNHDQAIDLFSTAERLSWAAHRNVAREEDEAYSLLGLFDVNMPLLYGEGRKKAFARFQETVYSSTADHSMFLYRHSLHVDGQPLLADSPTRFCERSDCASCLSCGTRCLTQEFRYTDVLPHENWSTQAHEQITTTVTALRNEMSTVLPLLKYGEVSDKLVHFDNDRRRNRVTHVAVLNHTLEKYPQGALCIFLDRRPGLDASFRLTPFPAILPHLGDFVSRLQKTKVLICPGSTITESYTRTETTFLFKSSLFEVEVWDTKDHISHSIQHAHVDQNSSIVIRTGKLDDSRRPIEISCGVAGSFSTSAFSVQLIQKNDMWSIKEVFERTPGRVGRKLRTRFVSSILTDRCTIQLSSGQTLLVGLRRLPASARSCQKDNASKMRYQITVDQRTGH